MPPSEQGFFVAAFGNRPQQPTVCLSCFSRVTCYGVEDICDLRGAGSGDAMGLGSFRIVPSSLLIAGSGRLGGLDD